MLYEVITPPVGVRILEIPGRPEREGTTSGDLERGAGLDVDGPVLAGARLVEDRARIRGPDRVEGRDQRLSVGGDLR